VDGGVGDGVGVGLTGSARLHASATSSGTVVRNATKPGRWRTA
jgi:hypothetical protein